MNEQSELIPQQRPEPIPQWQVVFRIVICIVLSPLLLLGCVGCIAGPLGLALAVDKFRSVRKLPVSPFSTLVTIVLISLSMLCFLWALVTEAPIHGILPYMVGIPFLLLALQTGMQPDWRRAWRVRRIAYAYLALGILGIASGIFGLEGMRHVFGSARAKARSAACLSNTKQVAVALLSYADDHDDHLPKANRWTYDIMPYLKDPQLLRCPWDHSIARSSYAMNATLSAKKVSDIPNPSGIILVFEAEHPGTCPYGGLEADAHSGNYPGGRHNGGNNYAFADSHAKWMKGTTARLVKNPSYWTGK